MTTHAISAPALSVFSFESSYQVRVIVKNNEPWFVANDICVAIGIQNATQAVEKLDDDERSMFNIGLAHRDMFDNRVKEVVIINESGLYFLVLRSRGAAVKGSSSHPKNWRILCPKDNNAGTAKSHTYTYFRPRQKFVRHYFATRGLRIFLPAAENPFWNTKIQSITIQQI